MDTISDMVIYDSNCSVLQVVFEGVIGNRFYSDMAIYDSNCSVLQVVFEGVIGSGYYSDMAVDDVLLSPGTCGTPGDCDFEHNFCTWSNIGGDDFDWLIGRGSTPSRFTGPQNDHTQGNTQGMSCLSILKIAI